MRKVISGKLKPGLILEIEKMMGIYYQVFAPEDIRKNYIQTVSRINTNFQGLYNQWSPVNEFYFVINDKYKCVNADSEQTLKRIKVQYSLDACGFFTSSDLEKLFFQLSDDQIQAIVGFLPNLDFISLDYSVLNEVVGYIIRMPLTPITSKIKAPDWNEKTRFNNLTGYPAFLLNYGSQQLGALNRYLIQNTTLVDELQKGYSHNINFLFHDSRLLECIDPGQKYELYIILKELIAGSGKQYIITLQPIR